MKHMKDGDGDGMRGLTKLGRFLYRTKAINKHNKIVIWHPFGLCIVILMIIYSIPLCMFTDATMYDIVDQFSIKL